MSDDYHQDVRQKNTLLLREKLKSLPPFVAEFMRGIADSRQARTRIGYCHDLSVFFAYLCGEGQLFDGREAAGLTYDDLRRIGINELEAFSEHMGYYVKKERAYSNEARGKARKLSAIRTMFSYFYKKGILSSNPTELINMPKIRDKAIVRLEIDEAAKLLDEAEDGRGLSGRELAFHEHTKVRDLAILTLLLGTGIRVSECVGINIEHLNFETGAVKVTRKGGSEALIYFGKEVADALNAYLDVREDISAKPGNESALFLSLHRRRITVRAVEILTKKYARFVEGFKKISPHKLRSTYGTNLYRETGDIYLVADVLGHKDINTTKKHYAELDEDRRRRAADAVKIRRE